MAVQTEIKTENGCPSAVASRRRLGIHMKREKPTILIVDDEPQNIKILAEFLRPDFRIVAARNAVEAQARAKERPHPDLILLDVMMPEMNGYEVCRRLKSDQATSDIPIIFVTAMSQVGDEINGFELGAVDYITKPFSLPIVKARINTQLTLRRAWLQALRSARHAAIGQLAAGLAHEMNTPAQIIQNNLCYIEDGVPDLSAFALSGHNSHAERPGACDDGKLLKRITNLEKELPLAISESRDAMSRIASIVASMKEFTRPLPSSPSPTDLNRLIETVLSVTANSWKPVAAIRCELHPDLPQVECHSGEIAQVLINLVTNAAEAVETSGKPLPGIISLSTHHADDWVEILIRDNGSGIPSEMRDHIFDPFFTTKPVGKGMGLGLAICHDVILKHRGQIMVNGEAGESAVFTVRLPIEGVPGEHDQENLSEEAVYG